MHRGHPSRGCTSHRNTLSTRLLYICIVQPRGVAVEIIGEPISAIASFDPAYMIKPVKFLWGKEHVSDKGYNLPPFLTIVYESCGLKRRSPVMVPQGFLTISWLNNAD